MDSALPGFRGRIATIRLGPGEGGANLFMPPEAIARVALRGQDAGKALLHRFTEQNDEVDGYTRTDRYRWIRLRMALRDWRGLAIQASARAPLYKARISRYRIPASLSDWFAGPRLPPMVEPYTDEIDGTLDHLVELAHTHLAEEFDGTPPISHPQDFKASN